MTTTLNKLQNHRMVNTCVVPGCGSRSDRDHHLSFHLLPLKNKPLLKKWLHQIGRKNVPLNKNSRVCSRHFKNSRLRKLHSDEYPTENLPRLATQAEQQHLLQEDHLYGDNWLKMSVMMTILVIMTGWNHHQHKTLV